MKKIFIIICILLFSFSISGQENSKQAKKVVYRYKQYEKFDFEDLKIQAETGDFEDMSVRARVETKFSNKLPYRKNFNAEIRKAAERVR